MTITKLPQFNAPLYRNLDLLQNSDYRDTLIDGFVNELGYTFSRSGYSDLINTTTNASIDGLYWWVAGQVFIAVTGGRVFKITSSNGAFTEITGSSLSSGTPVSFTSDGTRLFMANGGQIQYMTTSDSALSTLTGDNTPTAAIFLAYVETFLCALEADSNYWSCSNAGDYSTWSTGEFGALFNPDVIKALLPIRDELYALGERSMEVFITTGGDPFFTRLSGTGVDRGVVAPYSAVSHRNTIVWLDHERKVQRIDNRTPQVVSAPIALELQNLTTVSDAVAYAEVDRGRSFYVINFPTDNVTWAYDYDTGHWHRRGKWDNVAADYDAYIGRHYAYSDAWNLHIVGDRSTGKIYKLDSSLNQDAGDILRFSTRTGHIDHCTMERKESKQLIFRVRRGVGDGAGGAASLMIRWRSDNGSWLAWRTISLGSAGQNEFVVRLHSLGQYRTRQYEAAVTDNVPVIIMSVEEDVEVLR